MSFTSLQRSALTQIWMLQCHKHCSSWIIANSWLLSDRISPHSTHLKSNLKKYRIPHSTTSIAGKRHLQSARTGTLSVPRTTTTLGMKSFTVAGLVNWNGLPAALRTATLSHLTFARHLKAHLFGWSAARLRTIYDALYKSTHHHHHHHHHHCSALATLALFFFWTHL